MSDHADLLQTPLVTMTRKKIKKYYLYLKWWPPKGRTKREAIDRYFGNFQMIADHAGNDNTIRAYSKNNFS